MQIISRHGRSAINLITMITLHFDQNRAQSDKGAIPHTIFVLFVRNISVYSFSHPIQVIQSVSSTDRVPNLSQPPLSSQKTLIVSYTSIHIIVEHVPLNRIVIKLLKHHL